VAFRQEWKRHRRTNHNIVCHPRRQFWRTAGFTSPVLSAHASFLYDYVAQSEEGTICREDNSRSTHRGRHVQEPPQGSARQRPHAPTPHTHNAAINTAVLQRRCAARRASCALLQKVTPRRMSILPHKNAGYKIMQKRPPGAFKRAQKNDFIVEEDSSERRILREPRHRSMNPEPSDV